MQVTGGVLNGSHRISEYHIATDLLRKQRPNESLQDYIAYWTEKCHCSMKMDPNAINNKLVIILFVKNMHNKEICRRVAGAKNINTLLDAFKSAQMNLLKLKKYEGLVSDENMDTQCILLIKS